MSAFERETALSSGVLPYRGGAHPGSAVGPSLRYSSARPWLLGLAISSAMWGGIGWLVWKLI